MIIYIVLIMDRHVDLEIKVFADCLKALDCASKSLPDPKNGKHFVCEAQTALDESMLSDDCLFYHTYSTEGDYVCVFKSKLN